MALCKCSPLMTTEVEVLFCPQVPEYWVLQEALLADFSNNLGITVTIAMDRLRATSPLPEDCQVMMCLVITSPGKFIHESITACSAITLAELNSNSIGLS